MYGGASAVAFSRMYNNQHWATDVIMAAGIGTFAGNKVIRFNHQTNKHNRLDKLLLSASIMPTSREGFSISWSVRPQ
jgi:membrane-associated phospholipid phosphatase